MRLEQLCVIRKYVHLLQAPSGLPVLRMLRWVLCVLNRDVCMRMQRENRLELGVRQSFSSTISDRHGVRAPDTDGT